MHSGAPLTARRSWHPAIVGCVGIAALALAGSAYAGGSTGSVVVVIRAGSQHAPATISRPAYGTASAQIVVARPGRRPAAAVPRVRASAPGPTASLALGILPGVIGLPVLVAGSWSGLLPIWANAASAYGVPWQVLAAINKVETNNGTNLGPSSAGAVGWMQFMPGTWAHYGVDANRDGVADPNNPVDAIASAARYLAASGARSNLAHAIYAYNHAWWYVDAVLALARSYGFDGGSSTHR